MSYESRKRKAIKEAKKAAAIEYVIDRGIDGVKDIDYLVNNVLPIKLSKQKMCHQHDHISQFDYFSSVMLNKYKTIMVWANRGGSKTYTLALINWLDSLMTPGLLTNILGASEAQSLRAYEGTMKMWGIGNSEVEEKPLINKFCSGQPLTTKTKYRNGSETQILTASEASVRGPHPHVLRLDEVDVMKPEILEAAMSQPMQTDGIPSQTVIVSTNHVLGGNMDILIESNKDNKNFAMFKWCIWECLTSCKDYSCSTCPLSRYCPGEHMKNATGYYEVSDFIEKLYLISEHGLKVEWLCTKVGHPDMVYGHELEDYHFINIRPDLSRRVYLSADWGGDHPFAILAWQDFRDTPLKAWALVDELYMEKTSNPHVMAAIKKKPWVKNIASVTCDPSRRDLRIEWADNFPSIDDKNKRLKIVKGINDVPEGIEKCKAALKPVIGEPMVYFSNRCKDFRTEMYSYKVNPRTGIPKKENDHGPDAFRYFVSTEINPINKKSKSTKSEAIQSKGGNYARRNRR